MYFLLQYLTDMGIAINVFVQYRPLAETSRTSLSTKCHDLLIY